jgi:hypothetical protein
MAFSANVFKVLIASPGDVDEERQAIVEVIARWNDLNSEANGVVLLPARWETQSAPLMGGRAQGVVHDQVVVKCDMAVGVFWTRLGSPTGVSESGTAEEIEWFINNNKPVMVYFSSRSIDPAKLDIEQYKALKSFESKMQKIGLTGAYASIPDFKDQLLNQISINVRRLMVGEPVTPLTPKEVHERSKSIRKIMNENRVYMEDYEKNGKVKAILVKGDTKQLKDKLKAAKGRWNRTLGGWVFPKTREVEIAELIKQSL